MAEPQVLLLKLLQTAKLVTSHPAILLALSIVRLLRYAYPFRIFSVRLSV